MQERKVVKNIPISNNFVKTIILSSEGLVLLYQQKLKPYLNADIVVPINKKLATLAMPGTDRMRKADKASSKSTIVTESNTKDDSVQEDNTINPYQLHQGISKTILL